MATISNDMMKYVTTTKWNLRDIPSQMFSKQPALYSLKFKNIVYSDVTRLTFNKYYVSKKDMEEANKRYEALENQLMFGIPGKPTMN